MNTQADRSSISREEVSATQARKDFANLFNKVALIGSPVVVKKYSQTVAIVPIEYLERLEKLEMEIKRMNIDESRKRIEAGEGVDILDYANSRNVDIEEVHEEEPED